MKTKFNQRALAFIIFTFCILMNGCVQQSDKSTGEAAEAQSENAPDTRNLNADFKSYWYAGDAEITSYTLEQARYGEMRDGHAVLIYVTEPFLADKQVKADIDNPGNIPVLKLNLTKKFVTGIYPYSVMSSIYYPVKERRHAIKASCSVQEWCGHVYTQLNNREGFEVVSHSYFEKEADQRLRLEKGPLEDEVWTMIRVDPSDLPMGNINMVPSLEYIRLGHREIKSYEARATLTKTDTLNTYELTYPDLERSLRIYFKPSFPHAIEGWAETVKSGIGDNAKLLTTRAKKLRILKSAYWQRNGNKDVILRDSLGL